MRAAARDILAVKTWADIWADHAGWGEEVAQLFAKAEGLGLSADDLTFIGRPIGGSGLPYQLIFGDWSRDGKWLIVTASGLLSSEAREDSDDTK